MNVRLARRGRGGFALTEKGKTIYEGALKLFESLNEFAWMVDGLDDALSGELSILCSDEVALARQLRLPETIAWIHEKAPKLQIALNSDT
ncbi:MAG: LysR family transcriptional regulator, partial [Gammaproteobacteria bacterium]